MDSVRISLQGLCMSFLDRFNTFYTTGVLQFNTMQYNIVNSNSDLLSNSVTYGLKVCLRGQSVVALA